MPNLEFRLWSKVAQCMIPWEEIKETGKYFTIFEDDRYIPMQYTGRKDKNGVKIFEGDIIGKKGGAVHAIIYSESDAKYISKFPPFDNELTGHCGLNQLWIDECQKEIIGNIHSEAKG